MEKKLHLGIGIFKKQLKVGNTINQIKNAGQNYQTRLKFEKASVYFT
jgi:hypothetical protein